MTDKYEGEQNECTCPHMDLNEPAYNHDPNCVGRKQPAAYGKVPGCEDCAYNGRYLCDEHGPKPAAVDVALIEALRAEVDSVTAEAFEWRDKLTGEKDRAERLAEALRKIAALKERESDELRDAVGIANETLEQEK